MGNAFHRKRIPLRPRIQGGLGIKYIDPVPPPVAEQTPGREQYLHQQEAAKELQELRRTSIATIVNFAGGLLRSERGVQRISEVVKEAEDNGYTVSGASITAAALKIVRSAAEQSCVDGVISVQRFLKIMDRRADAASKSRSYVDGAIDFVSDQLRKKVGG